MKHARKLTAITCLAALLLVLPWSASAREPAHPLFAPGERSEWMGTYFKGKKLGFSFVKMQVTEDAITVSSKVFFQLKTEGVNQGTTFTQDTYLTPDLELKRFSLVQEIMGNRQQVDAHVDKGNLIYHVAGLGFDQTKSIAFPASVAPSSTFLLNVIKEGMVVGKKGKLSIFMEPFQMLMDLEYSVLRREPVEYEGETVDAFVIFHRVAGMESTLWVTPDGSIMKEVTPQGFESRREPETIARDLGGDAMSVSSLITLSLVKPGREIPASGDKRRMTMKLSKIRSPELIPQDHRQKVLQSEQSSDGTYVSTLLVNAEPEKVAHPSIRPVSSFAQPEYLGDSPEVQTHHPMIQALARELVGDTTDAWQASLRINQWVFDNLEKALVDTVSALNALKERKGECQSHTYLFAAIARAAGIPTKIVNGLVYSPKFKGFLYHAWPEVYVGEWRALDPTFGQDIVDATHIKLSEGQKEGQFHLMEFIGKVQIELIEN